MKIKKGFTLAEVIIAVGIIGVVAALMATAFNQAKPDSTKFKFLKAYDGLQEAIIALEEDKTLFADKIDITDEEGNPTTYDISYHPFLDTAAPTNAIFFGSDAPSYAGKLKFAKLLAFALKGEEVSTSDSASYTFKSSPGNYTWKVTPRNEPKFDGEPVGFANEIELSFDDHTFNFCVQANGEMYILDESEDYNPGYTYLMNRTKVKSKNDKSSYTGKSVCEPKMYAIDNNKVTDTLQEE